MSKANLPSSMTSATSPPSGAGLVLKSTGTTNQGAWAQGTPPTGYSFGGNAMLLGVATPPAGNPTGANGNPTQADVEAFNAMIYPRRVDMVSVSANWGTNASPLAPIFSGQITEIAALGAIPICIWDPTDCTLGSITGGSHDAVLLNAVYRCQLVNGPIIIRLCHEFNIYQGGSGTFGYGQESAASFVSGWQYVYNFFHGANVNGGNSAGLQANNVIFAWTPNHWNPGAGANGNGGNTCDPTVADSSGVNWYPGDAYVDLTGGDFYFYSNMAIKEQWPPLVLPNYGAVCAISSRPYMVTETGVAELQYYSKPEYFDEMFYTLLTQMPRCVGMMYWNQNVGTGADYTINTSGTDTAAGAAFQAGVNAPPFAILPGVGGVRPQKPPVAAAATTNISSLSGLSTIDGYTLVANDRVLLTAQSTASQNGLWMAASGAWSRPADYYTNASIPYFSVDVLYGTVGAGGRYVLQVDTPITVDTTSTTWVRATAGSGGSGTSTSPVQCVATASVTSLSGLQTFDGYTCVANDRVLLVGQTTSSQNGVWTAVSGSWTRPTDYTGSVANASYDVVFGAIYGGSRWVLQTDTAVIVNTTATTWVQNEAVSQIAGPPGLNWRGAYNSGTTYGASDAVQYNGSSFVATAGVINVAPYSSSPTSPTAPWNLLAEIGATGSSDSGGISPAYQAFTSSGSYITSAAGVYEIRATGGGGGGGGAGSAAQTGGIANQVGGGGGAAGAIQIARVSLAASVTLTVTVGTSGAGGPGGAASTGSTGSAGNSGTSGGASSVSGSGMTTLTATGGGGGTGSAANSGTGVAGGLPSGSLPAQTGSTAYPGYGGASKNNSGMGYMPYGATGGAGGYSATASNGGSAGFSGAQNLIVATVPISQTGTTAGGTPNIAPANIGAGGGGGGGGAPGGSGGNGANGSSGFVEILQIG
jgi:hypothetical protein